MCYRECESYQGVKMRKFLATVIIVLSPVGAWTVNAAPSSTDDKMYVQLVKILKTASTVGDCTVSLSGAGPGEPADSWVLNILRNPGGLITFGLTSPKETGGRTRTSFNVAKSQYRFAESDIVGWVNLYVQLGTDGKTLTGLRLDKSLPTGSVYEVGAVCGAVQ